jgi:frataxin
MLSSTEFHQRADQKLEFLQDHIESLLEDADVDLVDETLTVILTSGQQYIINKHAPTQQIWVASPVSGAHHFRYDTQADVWCNVRTGQVLDELLNDELKLHAA